MRDRIVIFAALAAFMALLCCPFWYARSASADLARVPNLQLPANEKQCVAPLKYMRSSHMKLLLDWREDVVRRGQRSYIAYNGKVYDKSLSRTCLGCHNKRDFCDRCHEYAGVSGPSCWNCHNAPQSIVAYRSEP